MAYAQFWDTRVNIIDEYPEIFCVEYSFKETNIEAERIAKHNKKIKDVEETLLTSMSMEPYFALLKQYGCFKLIHFSKKIGSLSSTGSKILTFGSHC